ncbi:DUF6292 family protein [Actinomadura formosensis]|uniref:DUF6292 family protein n=1 Tax=Actinomadura formosensis TaxID=60706 RepID=UPI003D8C785A
MSTPLAAYMDAVTDALMAADVGVRDHYADEHGPQIGIDLDPVSAVRQPTMLWTPAAGWRIAMLCRGDVRRATLRWLAAGPVPYPAEVVAAAARWLADPGALTGVAPVYDTVPHLIERALAEAAR